VVATAEHRASFVAAFSESVRAAIGHGTLEFFDAAESCNVSWWADIPTKNRFDAVMGEFVRDAGGGREGAARLR